MVMYVWSLALVKMSAGRDQYVSVYMYHRISDIDVFATLQEVAKTS